ncbi:hypothetical protein KIW84_046321 [Lathyrus oleraceus]|uniref:Integrase catalytic domain-containing protein n=1 Tax=Pisum sativum TaxID=3888 RepID=A0A9D4XQM3_PEA|nr:hypothetical protein KIW84_046321 [Pisum sativum]KAI5423286.1 hypothetical protein KIW84_046321 [Pisum sativum]
MSSSYHPETDGQTEVVNKCLKAYLRCFASEQPKNWSYWVSWAELWYNSTYHVTTDTTPFEVVYGRKPPPLIRFSQGETRVEAVASDLVDQGEALRKLKHNLLRAQQQMKKYADKKRRDVSFEMGEWVFLKLKPHRQQTVARRINQKLVSRYFGPYPILARVGAVSYKLKLPESARIHSVFHVSQLKKAVGNYTVEPELPVGLEVDDDDLEEPESLMALREIREGDRLVKQWIVKWKGRAVEDTTWVDESMLKSQFPHVSLEDKPIVAGVGNDRELDNGPGAVPDVGLVTKRPITWKVYSRRKVGQERENGRLVRW